MTFLVNLLNICQTLQFPLKIKYATLITHQNKKFTCQKYFNIREIPDQLLQCGDF